jgi:uncharacterized protein YdhG (YjbR/CyaY superfamily)
MNVNDFIKTNKHSLKKELAELREVVSRTEPSLTEHIKWNAPSFCHNGDDRITFNLSKPDAILLIFHRGAKAKKLALKSPLLKVNSELLEWPSPDRGVMKFKSMAEVISLKGKLSAIVKDWIAVTSDHAA